MKTICVILFLFLILCLSPARSQTAKNIAYQDDHVRITLIDDGAVRLEYSPEGKFIDDCSQIAVIRDYAPVDYKVCNSSKKVRILTGAMTITYAPSSFTQKMEFFHDRYARLDEVLKAQKLNDADYKFFIDYTY